MMLTFRETPMYVFLRSTGLLCISMIFAILMNTTFKSVLIELSEIKDSSLGGFLSTIYALITAFILVSVWGHYNDTKQVFSQENETLISLWVNTDFLDDPVITEKMRSVLLKYIDSALNSEFPVLAQKKEIELPSPEFIEIKKVIDQVKFDDDRDAVGFEQLLIDYRELTKARNKRIEFSLIKIPSLMRNFYKLASVIFWVGFLIQGFSSEILYYLVLLMETLLVIMSYTLIFDLERPLAGLVRLPYRKYYVSRNYIESTDHEVFHD